LFWHHLAPSGTGTSHAFWHHLGQAPVMPFGIIWDRYRSCLLA